MPKVKRVPRKKIDKSEVDLLKPVLGPFDFGTDKDPCFGRLHDLKADECKRCGDAEICSIVTAQKMNVDRLQIEATQDFKDVTEPLYNKVERKVLIKFIRTKLKKGYSIKKVIKLAHKKFSVPMKDLRPIVIKKSKNLKK